MNEPEYEVVGITRDLTSIESLDSTPDFLEFQMDQADRPREQLQHYDGSIPLIVSWNSSEPAVTKPSFDQGVIIEVAEYNFVEYIDLDIVLLEESNTLREKIESIDAKTIVSCYYPDDTPPKDEILFQIRECDNLGEVTKIISYASDRVDALNLLRALSTGSQSGYTVAGYCRGTSGKYIRIISVLHGSKFCYGTIDGAVDDDDASDISLEYLTEMLDTVISGADDVELMDALKGKFF